LFHDARECAVSEVTPIEMNGRVAGGIAGGIAEGGAGGGPGEESCRGIEEDREDGDGRTERAVVVEAQMALAEAGGVVVNVAGGDGILRLAHGSLREWLAYHKSFYGGSLRPSPGLLRSCRPTANY
jgi:hypothetical protein